MRMRGMLGSKKNGIVTIGTQLKELDPLRIIERGYAIAYDESGKVLRSPDQVVLGEDISVRVAQGQLGATVRTKKKSRQ